MPTPSVRRPPESASSVAACFTSSAVARSGAIKTRLANRTRRVTAAAAASTVRQSWPSQASLSWAASVRNGPASAADAQRRQSSPLAPGITLGSPSPISNPLSKARMPGPRPRARWPPGPGRRAQRRPHRGPSSARAASSRRKRAAAAAARLRSGAGSRSSCRGGLLGQVAEALRFHLEAGQGARRHDADNRRQAETALDLGAEPIPEVELFQAGARLELDHQGVQLFALLERDLELVDLGEVADDVLDHRGHEPDAPDLAHVVSPALDPALVEVPGPAAAALGVRHPGHQVARPVAEDLDPLPAEARHDAHTALPIADRLERVRRQYLLDVVGLDDVAAARFLDALEHENGGRLGHARGVAAEGAEGRFDLALGSFRPGFAGRDDDPHAALLRQVDAELACRVRKPERVGRRAGEDLHLVLEQELDALLGVERARRDDRAADLLEGVLQAPEADEKAVPEGDQRPVPGPHAHRVGAGGPHLGGPGPVPGRVESADRLGAAGAAGLMVADRQLGVDRREDPVGRGHRLGRTDLLALEQREAGAVIVERLQLVGRAAGGVHALPPELGTRVGVLELALKLVPLAAPELVTRHGLRRRMPVAARQLGAPHAWMLARRLNPVQRWRLRTALTARNWPCPMTSTRASDSATTVASLAERSHIAVQPKLSPASRRWDPPSAVSARSCPLPTIRNCMAGCPLAARRRRAGTVTSST